VREGRLMTPQARSGVSAAAMGSEESAAEARLAAFRLTEAVQIRDTGDELADRLAEAVSQGWHDVVRLLLYADAVVAWTAGDPRLEETLERLRDRAQREGDDVGVATALSMLAEVRSTTESARIREESDHDLARATALLAVAEGGALERARAFMSCAAAYQRRELWELEEEMYERASALLPDCEEPLLDRVVLVNLTGSHALHACALREVGELEQAGTRLTPGLEAAEAALRVDMPDTYQVDVRIFRHLLVAVVGAVEVEPAAALTGSIETAGNPWPEAWYGSLSLAEAVRAADRGDWAEAARLASDALARLGETSSPELGLALRVAAEADAALGAPWRRTRAPLGAALRPAALGVPDAPARIGPCPVAHRAAAGGARPARDVRECRRAHRGGEPARIRPASRCAARRPRSASLGRADGGRRQLQRGQ